MIDGQFNNFGHLRYNFKKSYDAVKIIFENQYFDQLKLIFIDLILFYIYLQRIKNDTYRYTAVTE